MKISQGDCLPGFSLLQTVNTTRINNASLLWHVKVCDKIRPLRCVMCFEILKAELEGNSDPRFARFFLWGKRNHRRFRSSGWVLGLNALNYPLSWIEQSKFVLGKKRSPSPASDWRPWPKHHLWGKSLLSIWTCVLKGRPPPMNSTKWERTFSSSVGKWHEESSRQP